MSILFPASIDSFTHPNPNDPRSGSTSLSTFHSNLQDAITALETKVGADASATTTTHDYKLSGVTGTDKAVSKTGIETLTNKTLTAPKINIGSDATGDIYYRDGSGIFQRLPIGSAGQILDVSAGLIPEWIPNPAAANASTTVKGVVEIATDAEMNAGTATGGTGAVLAIAASSAGPVGANKLIWFTSANKYPANDGSLITGIVPSVATKLSLTATEVRVDNTSTETAILTYSLPGGTLGTANAVRIKIPIRIDGNTTDTLTFKYKYGSTTMITATTFIPPNTGDMCGYIEFVLYANASTSAQKCSVMQMFVRSSAATVAVANANQVSNMGTASENSTGALNITITATWSSTNGTLGAEGITVEKVY